MRTAVENKACDAKRASYIWYQEQKECSKCLFFLTLSGRKQFLSWWWSYHFQRNNKKKKIIWPPIIISPPLVPICASAYI